MLKLLSLAFAGIGLCAALDFNGKLPGHVKLAQRLRAPEQVEPRELIKQQRQPDTARCAHILAYRADPRIDPNIHIPGSDDKRWSMPVHKGMPLCPEDVRELIPGKQLRPRR